MAERWGTSDALMAQAVEHTGLSDFGPGDFRVGLDMLLESLRRDTDLDPSADAQVLGELRRRLINRLLVEAHLAAHPAITSLPVRGPVDVMGLPRTGTTAMANLLSLDPQFRPLRGWEQKHPVPPPVFETESTDPRLAAALTEHDALPAHLRAMHLYDPHAAMEDSDVLGMAFHGQQYTMPVYGYHAWWRTADHTDTFAYHRRVVQLLGSQRPPNLWLFKAPHHKFHLEPIVAAYPDVRFVMTHRDPAKVIPSYASLVSALFPTPRHRHDLVSLGRELALHMREGMENAMAARARIGEQHFIDVHQDELSADPIVAVRRVYDFVGIELTPTVEQTMRDWQLANRSGAHGEHRYTPEDYGLTAAQLHDDFAFYIRHFDIRTTP